MNTLLWLVVQNGLTVLVALPLVWLVAHLRRSRPAEQYLLWLLLLVKLVTPPVVVWPVSLTEIGQQFHASADAAFVTSIQPPADLPAREFAPASAVASDVDVGVIHPAPLPPVSATSPFWWFTPAWSIATLWLLGTAAILTVTIHRILRQRHLVRRTSPAGAELHELVGRVAARMRLRPIDVRLSPAVGGPCVWCLGRPILIWPTSAKSIAAMPCTEAVIAHELAHLRRRDHWVSWLELFVLALWWWNPCYWLVSWKLHESRELACDAMALELCTADRREFADLLLGLSDACNPAFGPASLVGAGLTSRYSLRRRLEMVFNEHASGHTSWVGLALAGLLALAALPGWSWGQPAAPEPKTDPVPAPPAAAPLTAEPTAPGAENITEDPTPALNRSLDPRSIQSSTADDSLARPEEDELVQEIPLTTKGIKLQIRRNRNGALVVEVDEEGRKSQTILSVVEPARNPPTGAQPAADPPLSRTRAAARALVVPVEPATRDEKRRSSARATSSSAPSGWTRESRPVTGRLATDNLAKHDIELAEITLQEKTLELDAAREEGAKSGDSAGQRKVKLAELALRRAQIELERAKVSSQIGVRP
jgi:beta-lactamase regulating signal transducer with metallopeptidase domain